MFGGDKTIVTYKDAQNVQDPSEADQVMWGQVVAENGFRVMAYDVPSRTPWDEGENAFFVSVRGNSAPELTELWEKLSAGATIAQPLAPSGWDAPLRYAQGTAWVSPGSWMWLWSTRFLEPIRRDSHQRRGHRRIDMERKQCSGRRVSPQAILTVRR